MVASGGRVIVSGMGMATGTTRLVVIRHGESQAQVSGRVSGHDTCTGLSERGRRQAVALRDRLLAGGELGRVDAVYTSVLARSIETAAILRPALGDREPRAECDWCEIHAGEAEGLPVEELRRRRREHRLVDEADGAFQRLVDGAESWAECFARLGSRLRRVAREHPDQCVVVVGHGGTVGAGFVALGEAPVRQGPAIARMAENMSMTEWRCSGGEWQLVRFNDAAHLHLLV
jgi:probable phosphoglycerate mutase